MKRKIYLLNIGIFLLLFNGSATRAKEIKTSPSQFPDRSGQSISKPTTTITVNSTQDVISSTDGFCTLREAVIAANTNTTSGGVAGECPAGTVGLDTINLPAGTYPLQITGTNEQHAATGDLDIVEDLKITRSTAGEAIIDAQGNDRIFEVFDNSMLTLEKLTLKNGYLFTTTSDQGGGAILLNSSSSSAGISYSIFENNQVIGASGGAIQGRNFATFTVSTSIFRNNSTNLQAGAIFNNGDGTSIENCLFQGNSAEMGGVRPSAPTQPVITPVQSPTLAF